MPKFIDALTRFIGHAVAWLILLMVLGTLYNVFARYWFSSYSIMFEEAVRIMNAMVFLLAAPYILQIDKHVRVDVFYTHFSEKTRAVIDIFGTLAFLFPFCGFVLYYSWNYVSASWAQSESSSQTGGLPAIYLVKSLIIVVAILLVLQGVAFIVKRVHAVFDRKVVAHNGVNHG